MNDPKPNQIRMECMDCGKRYAGPSDANAPVNASLYMGHCGCKLPNTVGAPYYVDANGQRVEAGRRR